MNIDWSKAPEWAEYAVIGPLSGNVYFANDNKRQRDHDCALFNVGKDGAVSHINDGWRRIDRPSSEWTGQGLPPVGTVCEAMTKEFGDHYGWFKCTVLHVGKDECAIMLDNSLLRWCDDFRPIRIPEQIAAEDREKSAMDLFLAINWNDTAGDWIRLSEARREDYRKAIDAGYRKQEQPK